MKKEERSLILAFIFLPLGITVAVFGFLWIRLTPWVWYDTSPKPLGDKMEYVGKFDSGCAGFPCMGGGPPRSTYYYATNMGEEELQRYFGNGKVTKSESESGFTSPGYNFSVFSIESKSGKRATIHYYEDSNVLKVFDFSTLNKEHAISLDADMYFSIKDSL